MSISVDPAFFLALLPQYTVYFLVACLALKGTSIRTKIIGGAIFVIGANMVYVFHEFGHAVAASLVNVEVSQMSFTSKGGYVVLDLTRTPIQDLIIASAGGLTSAAMFVAICWVVCKIYPKDYMRNAATMFLIWAVTQELVVLLPATGGDGQYLAMAVASLLGYDTGHASAVVNSIIPFTQPVKQYFQLLSGGMTGILLSKLYK